MGQAEYDRALQSGHRSDWGPESLERVVGVVVEGAAAALRRRQRAQRAWERVASRGWLDVTRVEGVERGVVMVAVTTSAGCDELRRQAGVLGGQLAELVPGTCGLRFVVAAEFGEGARGERSD